MTNEELEVKLQGTMLRFLGLARELAVPVGPELFQMVESTVRASVTGAVSQTYEEAARAQCVDCRYGANYYLERGRWRHAEGECRATAIRSLQADLVQELISSVP
jgi:hypothetical protein